jgi:hypothetical protein
MSSQDSSVLQAKRLLTGLMIGESPRWHDGRLWCAKLGHGADHRPRSRRQRRGRPQRARRASGGRDGLPDGSMVPHADLCGLGVDGFNEIVVDGRGSIYVNGRVDFEPGEGNASDSSR